MGTGIYFFFVGGRNEKIPVDYGAGYVIYNESLPFSGSVVIIPPIGGAANKSRKDHKGQYQMRYVCFSHLSFLFGCYTDSRFSSICVEGGRTDLWNRDFNLRGVLPNDVKLR